MKLQNKYNTLKIIKGWSYCQKNIIFARVQYCFEKLYCNVSKIVHCSGNIHNYFNNNTTLLNYKK